MSPRRDFFGGGHFREILIGPEDPTGLLDISAKQKEIVTLTCGSLTTCRVTGFHVRICHDRDFQKSRRVTVQIDH